MKPVERSDRPRWYEVAFLVPHLWSEVLPHFLEQKGFSGLWLDEEKKRPHRLVIRAYLPEESWQPSIEKKLKKELKMLSSLFPAGAETAEVKTRVIEEEDWASKWLPFFEPLRIGPVWIRPREKSVALAPGEEEIILDPGQAFGTGHHESTQLCLEAILLLRRSLNDGAAILDLGAGSGILAMFAAKMGFRNILALDTDPVAVEIAIRNIRANGLEGFIEVRSEPLTATNKRFGLILANLSAPLHEDLAAETGRHLEPGGWLAAGGLLTHEIDSVLGSFSVEGLELVDKKTKNDWACLILKQADQIIRNIDPAV